MNCKQRIERLLISYPLLESTVLRGIGILQKKSPPPPGWSGIDYSRGVDYPRNSPQKPPPTSGDGLAKSLIEEYVISTMPSFQLEKKAKRLEKINRALSKLSTQKMKVVVNKYWRGMTDEQVGEVIGVSRRTVARLREEIILTLKKEGL